MVDMSSIMIMRQQEFCKSCRASCYFIVLYFILLHMGKPLSQMIIIVIRYKYRYVGARKSTLGLVNVDSGYSGRRIEVSCYTL